MHSFLCALQMDLCMDSVRSLLQLQNNGFCNYAYHVIPENLCTHSYIHTYIIDFHSLSCAQGDCGIAGSYQPPLPEGKHGNFIGQLIRCMYVCMSGDEIPAVME